MMKFKWFYFLFAFSIILFSERNEVLAQQTIDCPPCPEAESAATLQTQNFPIPGGQVAVTYKKYICNGVEILKIISIQPDNSIFLFYTPEEIHANTIFAILRDNPLSMPPMSTNSGTMWKITQPACWRQIGLNPTSSLVQCPTSTECCETSVFVFLSNCSTPTRSFEAINTSSIQNCVPPASGNQCFFVCDNKIKSGSSSSPSPFTH